MGVAQTFALGGNFDNIFVTNSLKLRQSLIAPLELISNFRFFGFTF